MEQQNTDKKICNMVQQSTGKEISNYGIKEKAIQHGISENRPRNIYASYRRKHSKKYLSMVQQSTGHDISKHSIAEYMQRNI